MPLALTPAEKIKRARALLAECRAMPEPTGGHARGTWVVKMRSRLMHADRFLRPRLRADPFSPAERAEADALRAEIDALYPSVKR